MPDKNKTYSVSVSYWLPDGGTMYVAGESEEQVRERVFDILGNFENVKIVHMEAFEMTQLEMDLREQRDQLKEELETAQLQQQLPFDLTPNRKDLN